MKRLLIVAALLLPCDGFGEYIDNMMCRGAKSFTSDMQKNGFRRELTLPFGWGEYEENVSHNIAGSHVSSYSKKARMRWALYTKKDGRWKLFQAVSRTDMGTGKTKSFLCEVKSGSDIQRH